MASDRARISFDSTRAYRSVIAQQGRVTLEADVNEQAMLSGEALRLETIDIVGPAGTPDDGYKVTAGGLPQKITVGPGTYYLGGWRLTLDEAVELGKQPEWLDVPALPQTNQGLVTLLVTEQSVSAVEDQALREVALGGPDSAARSRLIQQFPLIPVEADDCASAAAIVSKELAAAGVTVDPASGQLLNEARLIVGFVKDPAPTDPCTPAAAGGYLGADNQLIRITVIAYNAAKRAGKLLWGRNNASFVYRVSTASATPTVLTLQGVPVDQEHAPVLGQAVEILRSRVELKDGAFVPADMKDRNFVAADAGFVTTVAAAYDFDSGTLTLTDSLPAEYVNDPNPLFLRLWDRIVPFTAGTETPLDAAMGVTVTVTLSAFSTDIAARPFWRFAVRPDTPAQVYPVRYREEPQPPDGPRQWLGDLAVVGFAGRQTQLLADCRPTFEPLTKEKCGCCALTLGPQDVSARGGLQAVINSLKGRPAVLTLKPGRYELQRPLVLTGEHARLVIEGCGFGATISANPKALKPFVFGLVMIVKTDAVTLRGLEFEVAMVPDGREAGTYSGVMVADSGLVRIEDCTFTLAAAKGGNIAGTIFGGAVTVSGRATGLTVRRNRFFGKAIAPGATVCGVLAAVNTKVVTTALASANIEDNDFEQLNAGIVAFARLGEVRCAANRMRSVNTGIFLADPIAGSANAFVKHAAGQVKTHPEIAELATRAYPARFMATLSAAPSADPPGTPEKKVSLSRSARTAMLKEMTNSGIAAFKSIAASRAAAADAAGANLRAAAPAAAAATAPSPAGTASKADRTQFTNDIAHLDTIAVTAAAVIQRAPAVLHIENNDIALVNTDAKDKPGTGIAILRSPNDDPSMVLMTSNRVICGDNRTLGGTLLFVTMATVTGNMLIHPPAGRGGLPVFAAIGIDGGHYAYNGNLFYQGATIVPPRTTPAPNPGDFWPFLNTEL
jgi:hypothetical protein